MWKLFPNRKLLVKVIEKLVTKNRKIYAYLFKKTNRAAIEAK